MYPPNAFSRFVLTGIVLLAASSAACSRTSDRRFELRGQILSVSADR